MLTSRIGLLCAQARGVPKAIVTGKALHQRSQMRRETKTASRVGSKAWNVL